MVPEDIVADRREHSDRRERGDGAGRRGANKKPTSPLTHVLRSLGAIAILALIIVYTVVNIRPIYSTRGKLGEELRKHAPEVADAINPLDSSKVEAWMATPKFQEEKRNFFEDVMRLKQVDSARADTIATFAVREAYKRGISPAIIFGVMLTENSKFVSKATSNVGAVGLMQVYPKVWLTKEMTKLFGHDLTSDSTNVKYGVFILNQYFNPKVKGGGTRERDWQTALLRYNGCVKGTNTPRCHTYPSKVQRFVEGSATSICNGRSFSDCIVKPFIEGLMGDAAKAIAAQPAPPAPAPAPAPVPAPIQQELAGQVVSAPRADSAKTAAKAKPKTSTKAKTTRKKKSPSRKSAATKKKATRSP